MYLRREAERRLPSLLRSFPAVVVAGPRQVGMTTLLTNAFG
jgi:predicted AAA+ superfamily ATPase